MSELNKLLKQFIGSDQVDGSKILLENSEFIRAKKSDGTHKNVFKLNGQDKVEFSDDVFVGSEKLATDSSVTSKVETEKQRAMAAEGELLTSILSVDQKVTTEKLRAEAAESALQSSIQTVDQKVIDETARAEAAEAALSSSIIAGVEDAKAWATTVAGSAEFSARMYADSQDATKLAEAMAYTDSKITEVMGGVAPQTLDTIKEIADALQSEQSATGAILGQLSTHSSEISSLQSGLNLEVSSRENADVALSNRIAPIENIFEFGKSVIFENNAAVFADGQPGVEDANFRAGWYYQNMAAGQKINWYFHDGTITNVEKQNFNAYAVVTFDSVSSLPILAVYTTPTGTNDAMPGFAHSRYIYSNFSSQPVVGKKYLIHIGDAPAIHPELPRLQVNLTSAQGEQLPTERVLTASFGTNSGAAVGAVKLVVEHLGVSSPSYKMNVELKIRPASLKKLQDEQSARIAGDAALDAKINGNYSILSGDIELLRSDIEAAQSSISQEVTDRQSADANLQSQIDVEKARITALEARPLGDAYAPFTVLMTEANLAYVDLDREVKGIMSAAIGHLVAREGKDFSKSIVNGVTRLTFINGFAQNGSTPVQPNQEFHCVYAYPIG